MSECFINVLCSMSKITFKPTSLFSSKSFQVHLRSHLYGVMLQKADKTKNWLLFAVSLFWLLCVEEREGDGMNGFYVCCREKCSGDPTSTELGLKGETSQSKNAKNVSFLLLLHLLFLFIQKR